MHSTIVVVIDKSDERAKKIGADGRLALWSVWTSMDGPDRVFN